MIMRNLALAVCLSGALPAPGSALTRDGYIHLCEAMGLLSGDIMMARQRGVTLSEMTALIDKSYPDAEDEMGALLRDLARATFKINRFSDQGARRAIADAFGDQAQMACLDRFVPVGN